MTSASIPARVSNPDDLARPELRRIAIGNRRTSGVGKFTEQFLQYAGLDKQLQSRYIYGEHSAAVLDLVSSGDADIGIVYRTDTIGKKKVQIVAETPEESHRPVEYGLTSVWTSRNPEGGQALGEFLLSASVQESLGRYGFEPIREGIRTARKSAAD